MKISFLLHEPVRELALLAQIMETTAELGYHGIELSAIHPLDYPFEEIRALSARFDLPVVSFLSGWSYAHEQLCLSSPEAEVRRRAVERLCGYVTQAALLKAVIVMGMMQGLRSDEPDEMLANARIVDCLKPVAGKAQELGTQLVIEPVNHQQVGFNNTADEVAAMVARVASPGLRYMLDTIHMNIEERSVRETIRKHGPHIRHFHLCESNGGPFGTGSVDFPEVLNTLAGSGYNHYVSVKIYRKAHWRDAARTAAQFLQGLGVEFRAKAR